MTFTDTLKEPFTEPNHFLPFKVILGKVKDNWRHAHLKGVSSLHVLDKFSIALQLDRRVVQTADPNWPSLVVAGTLPRLNVHVNEDKVFALERMTSLLIGDAEEHYTSTASAGVQGRIFSAVLRITGAQF